MVTTKTEREKQEVIGKFKRNDKDTGSTEVQVALLTNKINNLVGHLKINKKDNHSRRGLLLSVGKRRRLMNYLKKESVDTYKKLAKDLGIKE